MTLSFSSREFDVKKAGAAVIDAVIRGDELAPEKLFQLSRIPRSSAQYLGETVLTLCGAQRGQYDSATVARMHHMGVRGVGFFGLAFSDDFVERELVPALLKLSRNSEVDECFVSHERAFRYEKINALAHLTPRLSEEAQDRLLIQALQGARDGKGAGVDLLLPIAGFEGLYRRGWISRDDEVRSLGLDLSIQAIRMALEESLSVFLDGDDRSLATAPKVLSLSHTACVAFLMVLPSVALVEDERTVDNVTSILSSIEFIISRGEGFPGNFFKPEEIHLYNRVRSVASICAAMLVLEDSIYSGTVREMRSASFSHENVLGVVALQKARHSESVEARAVLESLVREELKTSDTGNESVIKRLEAIEIAALTWHLGLDEERLIEGSLERLREPRSQYFLTKALRGSPWN